MAKHKTKFICQNCGTESAKWIGKCPSCSEWNTYVEEILEKDENGALWKSNLVIKESSPTLIQDVKADKSERFPSGNGELDRVLGGGVVNGSLVLIGGEPGIGKSTLLLQIAIQLKEKRVLYVSGEESPQQIKMRADRIGIKNDLCYLVGEVSLTQIFNHIATHEPDLLIIDSIQTITYNHLDAAPGSVSQVRECAGQLLRYAKESNVPVFLIGHINKEGNIAGPKVLEHMVDTVLQFEGDRHHFYRILRTSKNRFGSTSELGIYQMHESGLREVKNPSEMLLSQEMPSPGVAVGATMEGNRPLLIEVQALVSPATYGTPQRSTTGFDVKRLHMLLAVLERRIGLRLSTQDVFLNITGGIKVDDPSLDLAVCAAICSSYHDVTIEKDHCFVGEIGLGGEVRPVSRMDIRMKESIKLGFNEFYTSNQDKGMDSNGIKIHRNRSLRETFSDLFG